MKKLFLCLLSVSLLIGITGCGTSASLKGKWIATTENQNIYQVNEDGDELGGKEDYILECDGNGNYTLTLENNQTVKGTYTIDNNKKITFKDDSDLLVGICELSSDEEINCNEKSTYAFKYIKY